MDKPTRLKVVGNKYIILLKSTLFCSRFRIRP